jgi:hypothetical protein
MPVYHSKIIKGGKIAMLVGVNDSQAMQTQQDQRQIATTVCVRLSRNELLETTREV